MVTTVLTELVSEGHDGHDIRYLHYCILSNRGKNNCKWMNKKMWATHKVERGKKRRDREEDRILNVGREDRKTLGKQRTESYNGKKQKRNRCNKG